jgi:type III pantothenate kinase
MTGKSIKPSVAIDVGNSHIMAGLFLQDAKKDGLLPQPNRTLLLLTEQWDPVELALWLEPYRPADVDWFVGSVHEEASTDLRTWLDREQGSPAVQLLNFKDLPLMIEIPDPAAIGVDRLLGAVAANRIRPVDRPAIVIDLGSAITVDVISVAGSFRGGAILPGIQMSGRALHAFTDRLPQISVGQGSPPSAIGRSTDEAISSGIYWGTVGAIRALLTELQAGMSADPMVIVTGGNAVLVVEALEVAVRHEPHLILAGIAIVIEKIRNLEKGD